jgi:hypothetical protein
MARKKKSIDQTPICDAAYVRRIDPRWMPGPVPFRFWQVEANRRDYLIWIAHKQGLRTMQDLYRLKFSAHHARKYGVGLRAYWGRSAREAVEDCFPQHDWKPWLFVTIAAGFWKSPANRRSYLEWLGERLGYRRPEDWYQVTSRDFLRNRGKGMLNEYRGSSASAVSASLPGQWYEWNFVRAPKGFWKTAENRKRYLRWLGKKLGFRQPQDWYRIQTADIANRNAGRLLKEHLSLYDLMREFLPRLDWDRVDVHRPLTIDDILIWADAHHAKYGKWPTPESGKIPGTRESWLAVEHCLRCGYRGLPGGSSLAKFLEKCRGVRLGRRPPPLSEKQILAWADAFFAERGKWPNEDSGPIVGTQEKWGGIERAFRKGLRGLPGGSSLRQFLTRRRGARNQQRLPPLTEKRILRWVRAYHRATGRRPKCDSGLIAQSGGETWSGVNATLREGRRGLPGGSSLVKLLRMYGLGGPLDRSKK